MLKKCIRDIIEPMGFVNEGDSTEERWVAEFIANDGYIITIVAEEIRDEFHIPKLIFNACNCKGELVSKLTLDQLISSYSYELMPIPVKSNKEYLVYLDVNIQVPVDISAMSQQTYRTWIEEGCTSEYAIAAKQAMSELRETLAHLPINVGEYELDSVDEI